MFGRINKTKKSFITAVGMSLVLLMASAFGILIETNLGQITKPVTGTWADYAVKPAGSGVIHSDATMDVNDPYLIYTPQELAYIITNSAGKHIKLMADIDLSGHEWEPITNSYPASVFIYGNNHVISNLTINQHDNASLTVNDKIWLMSYGEAFGDLDTKYSDKSYFFSAKERMCNASDFSFANGCSNTTNSSTAPTPSCPWMTRTDWGGAYQVLSDGAAANYSGDTQSGIRPMISIG